MRHLGLQGLLLAIKLMVTSRPSEFRHSIPGIQSPVNLRLNTSDIPTFEKIFVHLEYQVDRIIDPKVIIDAGANIGLSAIYFSNKYPSANIIAIEPETFLFKLLEPSCHCK